MRKLEERRAISEEEIPCLDVVSLGRNRVVTAGGRFHQKRIFTSLESQNQDGKFEKKKGKNKQKRVLRCRDLRVRLGHWMGGGGCSWEEMPKEMKLNTLHFRPAGRSRVK